VLEIYLQLFRKKLLLKMLRNLFFCVISYRYNKCIMAYMSKYKFIFVDISMDIYYLCFNSLYSIIIFIFQNELKQMCNLLSSIEWQKFQKKFVALCKSYFLKRSAKQANTFERDLRVIASTFFAEYLARKLLFNNNKIKTFFSSSLQFNFFKLILNVQK